MPNSFYCQEAPQDEEPFTQVVTQCMEDISWPGSPQTYQHVANLVVYITAASPWMIEDSLPGSCEALIGAVASFSPGSYQGFLRNIVGIWGTNGTSIWGNNGTHIWGRGVNPSMQWSTPLVIEVPYLSQFNTGSPDDKDEYEPISCVPIACAWNEYFDVDKCRCEIIN